MVNSRWVGNGGDDKSGVAVFVVDGVETQIRFDRFADYYEIEKLLCLNFELGKSHGARSALAEINRVMNKHFLD